MKQTCLRQVRQERRKTPPKKALNRWRVFRPRRGSDPSEYPAELLDPRTCARDLLRHIYTLIPSYQPALDREARDAEIYQRRMRGVSAAELAQAYGLSLQRICAIIRRMTGKA